MGWENKEQHSPLICYSYPGPENEEEGVLSSLSSVKKYVTLGNSISVEVHHSCIYHVKTSSEMAPKGGTDDSLASNYSQEVRTRSHSWLGTDQGWNCLLKSGASLPTRPLHSLHTGSPAVLSIGAVTGGSLHKLAGGKQTPKRWDCLASLPDAKEGPPLPLSLGSPPWGRVRFSLVAYIIELLTVE